MNKLKQFALRFPRLFRVLLQGNNWLQRRGRMARCTRFSSQGLLQRCRTDIIGVGNEVTIGAFSRLKNCSIVIHGNNNRIIIAPDCFLADTELFIEDDNGIIEIGKNTSICGKTQLAVIEGCSIRIGEDCLFSSDISVRTGDSHALLNAAGQRINPPQNVVIGPHVWVGNRVIILKGVHLPSDCVVGAGAVVTKSVTASQCVIAGNPAKTVKESINWSAPRTSGN